MFSVVQRETQTTPSGFVEFSWKSDKYFHISQKFCPYFWIHKFLTNVTDEYYKKHRQDIINMYNNKSQLLFQELMN